MFPKKNWDWQWFKTLRYATLMPSCLCPKRKAMSSYLLSLYFLFQKWHGVHQQSPSLWPIPLGNWQVIVNVWPFRWRMASSQPVSSWPWPFPPWKARGSQTGHQLHFTGVYDSTYTFCSLCFPFQIESHPCLWSCHIEHRGSYRRHRHDKTHSRSYSAEKNIEGEGNDVLYGFIHSSMLN